MSTATPTRPALAPIPFTRLVGTEYRKAYNTRAGFWLLATIALLVVSIEVICLIVFLAQDVNDVTLGTFTGVAAVVASLLLPVLAIMLVTAEWTQRTAMVTFAIEPRRARVIWAKLAVCVLLTVATVLLTVLIGVACNAIFAAAGGTTTWWDSEFAKGILGFFLVQTVNMFVGFALGALLLNTAGAIVVFFAYSYVLPGLLTIAASAVGWFEDIEPWVNFLTAQAPLTDFGAATGEEWGRFVVATLIWVVLPLGLGMRRILRAEVK